jgi:2-polyprenyl-3-methyl-5-hydroxy-6-metoxy-1,4-benzoquinol methylase
MVQASRYLKDWIDSYKLINDVLDFGCGKLRYAASLASRARTLTLVDSDVQLSRTQTLNGSLTNIRDYVALHWPQARVLNFEAFQVDQRKYDLGLCANVLSSIPDAKVRGKVLRSIASSLHPSGRCLFASQFRNSYFKRIFESANSKPYLDGWLIASPHRNAYYGILPKKRLEKLVTRHGFTVISSWINGEVAYVLAQNREFMHSFKTSLR